MRTGKDVVRELMKEIAEEQKTKQPSQQPSQQPPSKSVVAPLARQDVLTSKKVQDSESD